MNYEIFYSLRIYLELEIPEITEAQMIYDGVSITDITKPFATIQDLMTNMTMLSAGRTSYEDIYRYQVGVFARSKGEQMKLAEKVRKALRNADGIPLYDDELTLTADKFYCDISAFTPLSSGEGENDTYKFHGYFDVAVENLA